MADLEAITITSKLYISISNLIIIIIIFNSFTIIIIIIIFNSFTIIFILISYWSKKISSKR